MTDFHKSHHEFEGQMQAEWGEKAETVILRV
jgi:hypothetical protein